MMKPYNKKLIEVAIPLEAINAASVREKSIRHGHPSTLHLWWARRPLAACRAVLFAQLVDDPSSHPDQFPTHEDQERERQRLFAIIEDLVKWENSTNEGVLERARAEILRSCGGVLPLVYDPFSGGGSIPLEAQRLGLPAYGSDLNPVAVMIGKAMIEIPPMFKDREPVHPGVKDRIHYRNAEGLAEDVKFYGEWMRERAWERIGHLYPQADLPKEVGGGQATVIAWIWARTVPSPDPAFSDVQVPLATSFLLSAKTGQEAWIEPLVDKANKKITYRIRSGGTKPELIAAKEGNKAGRGANFRCLLSNTAITSAYVKEKSMTGEIGQQLIAVVAEGARGRIYLDPSPEQEQVAFSAAPAWKPDLPMNRESRDLVSGRGYGFFVWGDLFTNRQLVTLNTLSSLTEEVRSLIEADAIQSGIHQDSIALNDGGAGARGYAEGVSVYLSFIVSRFADRNNSLCTWDSGPMGTKSSTGGSARTASLRNLFSRQAIAMAYDFGEGNPFSDSGGSLRSALGWVIPAINNLVGSAAGKIVSMDAQSQSIGVGKVVSTDPPYYDNISYADLSDFFYGWLKVCLKSIYPDLFSVMATPKVDELIASSYRHGGKEQAEDFFLQGMKAAIRNLAEQSTNEFPTTIYYAFKQSEIEKEGISSTGWATFLQAVVEAGYAVVGTWPVRTEMANRMIASGTNALANSVVLVCRKKEVTAENITRAEFVRALKRELPPAIADLQAANIAPADMPQSAIGPGMGVFSRYRAVLESDDRPMSVKVALQLINRELDEYLGGIQGEFDADTRFAITWFEQNGLKAGDYGTANNIATARGISVESVKHAGIVESQAGKVRVLRRDELDDNWEPGTDQHPTIWECLQHLVRLHEKDGISHATAVLLKKIGDKAEAVKDLAYILYDISANPRQDAKEATAYNALIADWTELSRQAASNLDTRGNLQQRLDL